MINTQGRLQSPEEFENIIIKYTDDGKIVQLKDVARVEIGAYTYADESYLNGMPAVSLAMYQLPGSNALDTANRIHTT